MKLDLNAGLTQVLSDGDNAYLYGLGRIGEETADTWAYHLPDALGSVRQLTNADADVLLAQSYEPYGNVLASYGTAGSNYGYTGEWSDANGLVHLRARYLDTGIGRFITRDTWGGDYNQPMSLNRWMYVEGNPVNFIDPSGLLSCERGSGEKELKICYQRVQQLKGKARGIKGKVKVGDLLPVEGFAKLADYTSTLFEGDTRGEMWGMTHVILGYDVHMNHTVAIGVGADDIYGGLEKSQFFIGQNWLPYKHDSSKGDRHSKRGDWNPDYWDQTPNQAYHFWYTFASTFYNGMLLVYTANIIHDPYFLEDCLGDDLELLRGVKVLNIWPKHASGTSKEDWNLTQEGINLGNLLVVRYTGKNKYPFAFTGSLMDIGAEIRLRLKE